MNLNFTIDEIQDVNDLALAQLQGKSCGVTRDECRVILAECEKAIGARKETANLDRHKRLFRWLQGPPLQRNIFRVERVFADTATRITTETGEHEWLMDVYEDHWDFKESLYGRTPTYKKGRFVDDISLLFEIIEQ